VPKGDDERGDDFEDEIKPQDGLLRYWTFLNGENYRLFAGLAAAMFGVLWCLLYVLGAGRSVFGIVLLALGGICVATSLLLDKQVRDYQERGSRKGSRSPRVERVEVRLAVALWLLIFISIGAIIFSQWRHSH
jgi:drug/metabolite transporter superfamily protein YnfA